MSFIPFTKKSSGTYDLIALVVIASSNWTIFHPLENFQGDAANKATFATLDTKQIETLTSVPQCVGKGYTLTACINSKAKADRLATEYGTALTYSDEKSCTAAHQTPCQSIPLANRWSHTTFVDPTTPFTDTGIVPPVVAWQVAVESLKGQKNINDIVAAPLYPASGTAGTVMRADKKTFKLAL